MTSFIDSLARIFDRLLKEGSVPKSFISENQMEGLKSLFASQVLKIEPKGRGQSVVVKNESILKEYIKKIYPSGLKQDPEMQGGTRKYSIEISRDSKTHSTVLEKLKVFKDFQGNLQVLGKESLPVLATEGVGLFSIPEKKLIECSLQGILGTIENWEAFMNVDVLHKKIVNPPGCYLYTGGYLSGRELDWLVEQNNLEKIIHFGDYDPVGLFEYCRLKNNLQIAVEFYIPPNLNQLFEKYSNKALLEREKNRKIFEEVRMELRKDHKVQSIINQMEINNAGLEQEIIFEDS